MKYNRVMWVVVLLFVTTTIVVTSDTPQGLSTTLSTVLPKATPPVTDPFGKYGVAYYSAAESQSLEASEQERRRRISHRYDNQGWVQKNPHPETGKIGRIKEEEAPPILPTAESDLIVAGRVVNVTTHVSNDKGGVYSEFKVKVEQVIKNGVAIDVKPGEFITVDRAGGVVRYPHGQLVLYLDSIKGLPEVGQEYLFFLKDDNDSENFPILTGYELHEAKTVPLDIGRSMGEIKGKSKSDFVKAVREELARRSGVESRREP